MMQTPLPLPIDDFLPDALSLLQSRGNLVITAAPGAGKTTRLPAFLARHSQEKVLVLEPRRMAAMAAAQRVAEEQNWTLGKEVGYTVRFAHKASESTTLVFLTEALLSRRLAQDPELKGVGCVVLDEFHERSLHVDLALGLLRELQELGHALKIVVMSATLDARKIADYLGGAPILEVPGKLFPLEIRYQKNSQLLQTPPAFYEALVAQVRQAQREVSQDLLIFLPGAGEIARATQALESLAAAEKVDLVPLHGNLPLEAQRKALQRGPRRRWILSTNIAESSVTVDGVAGVIDTGLAKSMKFNLRTGFSRLELGRISQASAQQRAGRAARQFPGICYRLWNKLDENSMPPHEVPEILRADLTESLLFLAAQGIRDFQNFAWFEKPPAPSLRKAVETLRDLLALDSHNQITALGKKMLQWPLPPRLAKLMIVGQELKATGLAADIAALLQERDFLPRQAADAYRAENFEDDLWLRWELLQAFREQKAPRNLSWTALQTIDQSARQILTSVRGEDSAPKNPQTLRRLLLGAYSDRLCRRRQPAGDRAVMVGGRGVRLAPESLVRNSEFFLALDGYEPQQASETLVSLAAGLSKDFLFTSLGDQIERHQELSFEKEKGLFYLRDSKRWRDLVLEDGAVSRATPDQVRERLPEVLSQEWEWVLKQNSTLQAWLERFSFLVRHREGITTEPLRSDLTGFSSELLLPQPFLLEAFTRASLGESDFRAVIEKDLVYFFESLLPAAIVEALRQEIPARIQVPSGQFLKIQYPADREPYMEVRIQEVFGWTETPRLLFGAIPLTLHLLGPNYRPMQVTSHLQSFWQNGYPEVRKELRARYPKHSWPEDPLTAKAVAKGRSVKS